MLLGTDILFYPFSPLKPPKGSGSVALLQSFSVALWRETKGSDVVRELIFGDAAIVDV